MKELFDKAKWKHLFYTMSHPSDGYYWIRHQEKGSVAIALLLVIVFSFAFSINRMAASFVVSDIEPITVNALPELGGVLLLYIILCVANWSVTCLMEGEGRLKDILIAVGYATLPITCGFALATVVSRFLAANEEVFYTLILGVGIAYGVILMMTGIMQVHNYTLGKTLSTLILTLIAVFIIVFLGMLMYDLVNRLVNFFVSVYTELSFRG